MHLQQAKQTYERTSLFLTEKNYAGRLFVCFKILNVNLTSVTVVCAHSHVRTYIIYV